MQTRIAVWSLSGVQQDAWRLHSSLALPPHQTVTALDSKSGNRVLPVRQCLLMPPRAPCCWLSRQPLRLHLDSGERPPDVVPKVDRLVCPGLSPTASKLTDQHI
jgi:hypothetical protein